MARTSRATRTARILVYRCLRGFCASQAINISRRKTAATCPRGHRPASRRPGLWNCRQCWVCGRCGTWTVTLDRDASRTVGLGSDRVTSFLRIRVMTQSSVKAILTTGAVRSSARQWLPAVISRDNCTCIQDRTMAFCKKGNTASISAPSGTTWS